MEIEEVITYHIPKQDDVSPISVFIINHDKGNFEVTITHRGCAWTARLFTHWEKEVEKFISTHASIDSLVHSFSRNQTSKEEKLVRPVIEAVRKYFKSIEVANYKAPEGFVLVSSSELSDLTWMIDQIDLLTTGNRPGTVDSYFVSLGNRIQDMTKALEQSYEQ
jgi:hypothetical protein